MENTIELLPKNFNISKDETVLICLKGTNKEWLICTDKKLYILKRGFMTGHLAGDSNFQMPYKNITGAHTDYHLLTGYFEVSTGGMQNVQKNYWAQGQNSPQQSPNCVTIAGKPMLEKFRDACHFINQKITEFATSNNTPTSVADEIKKYKSLLDDGVITQEEFSAKKKQLLGI
ncbi:MAG: SHOCT domain-containing protein [Candidatus Shapirobacteria bacterium]|nr:SHOCT domain-containing protein [Candidatus Shapirobacteria bacterium]MDD4382536.1 SHOCT domain-containing protein [Candidatus Shapirobacteria bacterium]